MSIYIDIGNSNSKIVKKTEDGFMSLRTVKHSELNLFLSTSQIFNNYRGRIITASVKQDILQKWENFFLLRNLTYKNITSTFASMYIDLNGYPVNQIGIDRLLSMIGAYKLFPDENVLIIDIGSAVTLDLLTKNRKFLGGEIFPGVPLLETAINNADNIKDFKFSLPEFFLGNDTFSCIDSGIANFFVSGIENFVRYVSSQIFQKYRVLITGGFTSFNDIFSFEFSYENFLVFYGINEF